MTRTILTTVWLGIFAIAPLASRATSHQTQSVAPEARAVAFLSKEVPRWKAENGCYSCHNNGDAARALLVAEGRGQTVGTALDDTLAWLRDPHRWNDNKTRGGIDDKPLARVQFAGALTLAVDRGRASREALRVAAALLVADQKADGSWQLDTSQSIGSPATYGTAIATWSARQTVVAASHDSFATTIARADQWLRAAPVETVLDASAVVLGLDGARDALAMAQRTRALQTIERGEAPGGGWGPYVTAAPEVFDTAVALLALQHVAHDPTLASAAFSAAELRRSITRGRAFLLSRQAADGSWPETTRPANQESYAQRISTTGWALVALLDTP